MKINSLEEFHNLELACLCGGGTKALLKAMTIEGGGKEETVLTVSYYLQDADAEPDAHRPDCLALVPTDGSE